MAHKTTGVLARQKRQQEAEARKSHTYSPEEQLARLDERLGAGVGATKERERLNVMLYGNKKGKR